MAQSVALRVGIVGLIMTIAMVVIGVVSNHLILAPFVPVGFLLGTSNLMYAVRLKNNIRGFLLATLGRLLILTLIIVGIALIIGPFPAIVTAVSVAVAELLGSSMQAARLLV